VTPQQEIKDIIARMFAAWNAEDQAGYLVHYWKSEEMRWSMKGAWYRGWSTMQKEFDRDYPPGAMGVATIYEVEVMMAAEDVGIALYEWMHELPTVTLRGSAAHVFRLIDGRWQIVLENVARVP